MMKFWKMPPAARLVEGTLGIGLILGLLAMFRSSPPSAAPVSVPIASSPQMPVQDRGAKAADAHIFGASPESLGPALRGRPDASVSIAGIVFAADEKSSVALLSVDGKMGSYLQGQTLPDGEVLDRIEGNAVTLEAAGRSRRIEMEIKFASTDAVFHGASLDGKAGSWADAYAGEADAHANAPVRHPAGIATVPAANNPRTETLSLKAIREARASRFAKLRPETTARPDH